MDRATPEAFSRQEISRRWRRRGWAALALLVAAAPTGAAAQATTISPYFMVLVDTSGSMTGQTGTGNNSCGQRRVKLSDAKCVLQNVVNSYGEAAFGLARFRQVCAGAECTASCAATCGCTCSGTCDGTSASGEILVPISEGDPAPVLRWIDYECSDCGSGGANPELMAGGQTPTGGAMLAVLDYYEDRDLSFSSPIPSDPDASCRPYHLILISDGSDGCAGNAVAAATRLRMTTVGGSSYDVRTFVIGFGVSPGNRFIEDVATAGGTDAPGAHRGFYASNETELSLAFSQIMADAILVEECNGVDDDCDAAVDEGFPFYCDRPGGTETATLCEDPGERVCDGLDDNCNGVVDEGLLNACGSCGPVPPELCNGADDDCDAAIDEGCSACVVEPEVCDGLDNDCDEAVDERLSRPCGTDVGECTVGTQTCASGAWGTCSGRGPSPEACDGRDNDCDGVVDGMRRSCGTDVGECAPGVEQCDSGAWGRCAGGIEASPETCDGRDDDCDGRVDEGNPDGGAACGSGIGACEPGAVSCQGGFLVCTGGISPSEETCDGTDEDCDGATDESVPPGASCGSAVGACRPGRLTCVAGAFACTGDRGPSAELCNGADDDCDGAVDEGDPGGGAACGTDVGECREGLGRCMAGALVCVGGASASPETCDGRDEDCDGATDEAVPPRGACGDDTGACAPGVLACVDGAFACTGARGPSPDVCNGADDDCDGLTDESDPGGGGACGSAVGACEAGVTRCEGGALVCAGETAPRAEACNGADDDCDGLTDEGNPEGGAVCGVTAVGECDLGVLRCEGGALICAGDRGPAAERCNGLDDDCDGRLDEDTVEGGAICGSDVGECRRGVNRCVGGEITCAGGTKAVAEECNGLDDDCDGATDEGLDVGARCGSDVGQCTLGVLVCRGGVPVCEAGFGPDVEACNGLDDDCDGATDEGLPLGAACGTATGVCEPGSFACLGGRDVCVDEIPPTQESCDCEDDDCDGATDEAGGPRPLCPDGSACVMCQCALPCSDSEFRRCPTGRTPAETAEGCFCVAETCDPTECAARTEVGEDGSARCAPDAPGLPPCECRDNTCAAPCDGVECAAPTVCHPLSGRCVEDSCRTLGCPEGELCELASGVCRRDPCERVDCGTEACRAGGCEPSCAGVACGPSEACRRGRCEPDPCASARCERGLVCDPSTGECVENPCVDVRCAAPLVCDPSGGACVAPPCYELRCPEGQRCLAGECAYAGPAPDAGPRPDGGAGMDAGDGDLVIAAGGCTCRAGAGPRGGGGAGLLALLIGLALRRRRPR